MGIPGLHPKIANATVPCHLKRFFGRVAAVDTSAWIHRCWQVSGSPSASVRFVLRRVELLHRLNIKPLMILDGRTPQAKEEEVARRTGGHCPPPKRLILRSLVKKFRKMRVDYLVSPFEADGQLAFVEKVEMADLIITEDGDTVVPGCTNVCPSPKNESKYKSKYLYQFFILSDLLQDERGGRGILVHSVTSVPMCTWIHLRVLQLHRIRVFLCRCWIRLHEVAIWSRDRHLPQGPPAIPSSRGHG